MADIELPLRTPDLPLEDDLMLDDEPTMEVEIELPDDEDLDVLAVLEVEVPDFDANLAEFIDEGKLNAIGLDLVADYHADRGTRRDWERTYIKGLDLLGMKVEDRTQPWDGASGVFHPILAEAIVRFQAQAMMELFPASGPARTKLMGEETAEKKQQAIRVETEINHQLTEVMTEYRSETEQLLFRVPLAGSGFRKVYYDPFFKRPASMFVPAEDFIIQYGASDLQTCPRYTHVMRRYSNEVKKLQASGFYRDIELDNPLPEYTDIQEKEDKLAGLTPSIDRDDRLQLLEVHADLDLPGPFDDEDGIAVPYVVTIDRSSGKVLSIYRNWREDDEEQIKRQHFVHYPCFPGMGFYGFGFIHLLGSLSKSATSILRQLIDAGTLSNLPGGLKSRGLRIKGDDTPISPGEWRDVDIPGTSIKDNLYPLPYKEPSNVLYQLLGTVVEEGRRMASISDLEVGAMSQNAPVGTTLALLERNMKVMSAVQARLHSSLKQELRLISEIINEYMPPEYDYYEDGDFDRQADFDGRVDVIPVSDPNASTMAQRVVQYQAALQLAQGAPDIYDLPLLHREMLEVLGIKNAQEIVKLEEDHEPMNPVSENMALIKQEPVKAFMYQDHESHIAAHLAAMEDPKIKEMVGQSPNASLIQASAMAHVAEHMAFAYRGDIEEMMGIELPPPDEPLPEEVEVKLSKLVAEAGQKLLERSKGEAAQKKAKEAEEDPIIQIQKRELAIKEQEAAAKAKSDEGKLAAENKRIDTDKEIAEMRITSQERQTGAKVGVQAASERGRQDANKELEGAKMGIEVVKSLREGDATDKREGTRMGVEIGKELMKDKRDRDKAKQDAERDRRNSAVPSGGTDGGD